MADRVHILGGDELDESLLAEALGRTGISDYVERDLIPTESDVDFQNAVVDIPAGKAFILDDGRDVMLLPDARAGVSLATDGVNHVFIYYDLSQADGERIGYHVDGDGTPPSQPALEIAEIDMGAQEVRPQNDTAPIYRRDAETYKGNDIDPEGDGVVQAADEAYLVQGTGVSGSVALADEASLVQGENVAGEVQAAAHAGTAGVADEAGLAGAIDGTAGGRSGVAELGSDLDAQWHVLDRVRRLKIRSGTDHNTGLDVRTGTDSDGRYLVRFIPIRNSNAEVNNELQYNHWDDVWNFRAGLQAGYSPVITRNDESGLNVNSASTAQSAGDAATLNGTGRDTLLTVETASIPSAVLDPGETVWAPMFAGGGTFKALSITVYNQSYDAPSGLKASLRTESGGQEYRVDGSPNETGTIDNPIKFIGDTARIRLQLDNNTGSEQVAGATCRYVVD